MARFAALAGGVAATGVLPSLAAAATGSGFDSRRRAIFLALLETYDGQGPIKANGRDVAADLARRYSSRGSDYREWVDSVLDALDVASDGPRFSQRDVRGRRDVLRGWMGATEPADNLMHKPRPRDAYEPAGLQASNEMNLKAITEFMASLPKGAKELDPVTGLPNFQPPPPKTPTITDGRGPTGTPVRLRRQLAHSSYVLLVSLFNEDTRQVTLETFA